MINALLLSLVLLFNITMYSENGDNCFNPRESQGSYDILYAPWRTNSCPLNVYTKSEWKKQCPFCHQFAQDDDAKHYIVKRFKHVVVMLNLHPYSPGHLMVVPVEHVATLDALSKETRHELMDALTQSLVALKEVIHYHGANVGINIGGKGTGGSIPGHVHVHVVPRWEGDNSFMASIAGTRVMNCDMEELYIRIAEHFNKFFSV